MEKSWPIKKLGLDVTSWRKWIMLVEAETFMGESQRSKQEEHPER